MSWIPVGQMLAACGRHPWRPAHRVEGEWVSVENDLVLAPHAG